MESTIPEINGIKIILLVTSGVFFWFACGWLSGYICKLEARFQCVPWDAEMVKFAWIFFWFGAVTLPVVLFISGCIFYRTFIESTSLWAPRLVIRRNPRKWYCANGPWRGGTWKSEGLD